MCWLEEELDGEATPLYHRVPDSGALPDRKVENLLARLHEP